MKRTATALSLLMLACLLGAELPPSAAKKEKSAESLLAEIEVLKAPQVAWRGIAWKTCLLEGLQESRASKKPVLLWAFIDRPIDDARC